MKLNNNQLIECLKAVRNGSDKLPDGVSFAQFKNLIKIVQGLTKRPAYMNTFVLLAEDYDYDFKAIKAALSDLQDEEKPLAGGVMDVEKPERLEGLRFVFTSAQNNTDVHKKFLKSLEVYCAENNASLHIGQYIYNKNGFQNGVQDSKDIYFRPELAKYFSIEQLEICPDLVWCGDLNILPTAKNPLTGFETYTGAASSIIPHAKIALESVPTPKAEQAKMLYATGSVTMRNYIKKKAGQLAEAAHCYGALVVEIDEDGIWYARQIQTNHTGIFQDLNRLYTPTGSKAAPVPAAINWGDIHAEKSDELVLNCCAEMLDYFKPKNQLFHDTFDMQARNHHNRKSGRFLAKMHFDESGSVKNDIKKAGIVLDFFSRDYCQGHVVESNHDLALESWLDSNDYDFKTDPINALTYLELQTLVYKALEEGQDINVLEAALNLYCTDFSGINFMGVDDSLVIAGIECGYHGHIGCNGSRGNPNQFQKLNRPINSGHTHTASIKGNIYTAGVTGSMDMGYNKGPSSWSHSHIVTYASGFRTIITMKQNTSNIYKFKA